MWLLQRQSVSSSNYGNDEPDIAVLKFGFGIAVANAKPDRHQINRLADRI